MENKVLVTLFVPLLETKYEVFLPVGKRIGEILSLLGKALYEVSGGYYQYKEVERLYNRRSGKEYPYQALLKETDIRNGTEVIFM